jgi:hypothetical protein
MLARLRMIPWLDDHRVRRVTQLLGILWVLSLSDLIFTLWAHFCTPFYELNPIARALLNGHQIFGLIVMKVALTATGALIFWRLRHNLRAELALWGIVIVYVMLTFRWSGYTVDVMRMNITML